MRRLYIGKNKYDSYEIGTKKKDWGSDRNNGGFTSSWLATFCEGETERILGIKLKPGEVWRIRITAD